MSTVSSRTVVIWIECHHLVMEDKRCYIALVDLHTCLMSWNSWQMYDSYWGHNRVRWDDDVDVRSMIIRSLFLCWVGVDNADDATVEVSPLR